MRNRNVWGGAGGGFFLVFLAIAFMAGKGNSHLFLPLLFVGIACVSFLGSLSSRKPGAIYGGLQAALWMLGLAYCFAFGFFPAILVVVGLSIILGAFTRQIMAGIAGMTGSSYGQQPNYQQPYERQNSYQEPYRPPQGEPSPQSYEQGYQAAPPQAQETYHEGGKQYNYPAQYDQPQAQYPQEMPPQQQ
ncbi:hypothetical protein EPA93_36735 [Ktedonosporobacter rubrisoli]|uniref:Uncharacterized protein n=1 Tax=Ktedonosporobacter rubrisoli TaxID=2509675 RepID=A0A4P6JZN1_KTERU|nr:hypothetical protein [Ktedonosporobacter rubrisoli]QBD81229.1 hypothetical protein EPA93_36735 [Ktedonosporobacter rubrisoli]